MIRGLCLVTAVFVAVASPASAKSELAPGNYVLYYSPIPTTEQPLMLIKVERKGGKDVGDILEGPNAKTTVTLEAFAVEGKTVNFTCTLGGGPYTFEGTISGTEKKTTLGSFGDSARLWRARLVATDKDKLADVERPEALRLPEPMQKAQKLTLQVNQLRFKLRQAKDDEAKADLKKQIEQAQKEADEQTPALYKEIIEKNAESPAVVDATIALFGKAEKSALKPEDAAKALKAVDTFAGAYGARYRLESLAKALDALASQKGFEAVALEYAGKAGQGIADSTTIDQQARVLKMLHAAQVKAGKGDLAKQTEARLAKIEEVIDKAYLEKVPPFKPAKFQGRKGMSDWAVVMELFTGAQCPPCVAADVAFDALIKSYKPTDLILIQYHMHIPGPDPLTNADSEARWKYYGNLSGTPSTLFNGKRLMRDFNGKQVPSGGGGMAQAQAKFTEYQSTIDPLLETATPLKLAGSVTTKGDTISIKVDLSDVKDPSENLKLRLVLVEETVKYVGGNGLRFHHQVVRELPGGADGTAVKEKTLTKSAEVDLAKLRKKLTSYLDDYAVNQGAFPYADRPMGFKHLRVIAFVQDDSSKEILQGIQLEVPASR